MTPSADSRPPAPRRASSALRDRAVTGALVAVLAVSAVVIALPHVAPPPASSPGPTEAASSPAPAPVVYREGVVGRPTSITPVTARTRADRTLVGLIFSGLVKLGPGNTLVPDLASTWTVDKTGKTWTVSIRPDARWQDGVPVTADDVAFTVAALKDPSAMGGLAASWADVEVAKVDDTTVEFKLGSPVGGFLAALTQPLLPAHLLNAVPMAELAGSAFALNPVGTGPYQLVQLDDARAVLVPASPTAAPGASAPPSGGNDGSGPSDPGASGGTPPAQSSPTAGSAAPSGSVEPAPSSSAAGDVPDTTHGITLAAAKSPKPSPSPKPTPAPTPTPTVPPTAAPDPGSRAFDRVEVDFFDTESSLAAAFKAGQIDGASGLTPATSAALGTAPGARVLAYPTTTLSAILLNLRPTHPELQPANVRLALLSALDRTAIATADLGGQARVADALVPPESWAYDASKVPAVAYDRTAAAKLLKAAGWTKTAGKWRAPKAKSAYKLELLTVSAEVNPRLAAVAAAAAEDWGRMGISATVTSLSGAELAARLKAGTFTAVVIDIASGLEPDLYPLLDSSQVRTAGSNRSGYQDPAIDQLLETARQNASMTKRKSAWSALLAGLAVKMPVLPVVWADEQMVVRGVSGNTPRLIVRTGDRFWDVLAWRLAASR